MQFDIPTRKSRPESVVPMINIVFLLLIFFLMTAQIAPPAPFEVTPPMAEVETPADGAFTLYINAGGTVAFEDIQGERALEALAAAREGYCNAAPCDGAEPALLLRVDGGTDGAALAKLMGGLGATGFKNVRLVTRTQ